MSPAAECRDGCELGTRCDDGMCVTFPRISPGSATTNSALNSSAFGDPSVLDELYELGHSFANLAANGGLDVGYALASVEIAMPVEPPSAGLAANDSEPIGLSERQTVSFGGGIRGQGATELGGNFTLAFNGEVRTRTHAHTHTYVHTLTRTHAHSL